MDTNGYLLADIPGFGRVFDCGNCGQLHVSVGPVSLTLSVESYIQLVALLNTSAANFESWVQANRDEIPVKRREPETRRMEGDSSTV